MTRMIKTRQHAFRQVMHRRFACSNYIGPATNVHAHAPQLLPSTPLGVERSLTHSGPVSQLPPVLQKEAAAPDLTPFPYRPWPTETPPIPNGCVP
jgi:hypothetical protein